MIPFPVNEPELWAAYVPEGITQYLRLFSAWGGEKLERLRAAGYEVVVLDEGVEKQLSGRTCGRRCAPGPSGSRSSRRAWRGSCATRPRRRLVGEVPLGSRQRALVEPRRSGLSALRAARSRRAMNRIAARHAAMNGNIAPCAFMLIAIQPIDAAERRGRRAARARCRAIRSTRGHDEERQRVLVRAERQAPRDQPDRGHVRPEREPRASRLVEEEPTSPIDDRRQPSTTALEQCVDRRSHRRSELSPSISRKPVNSGQRQRQERTAV